jgi:cellulose synthase/poly-beta-1,6-N-acetylglucosamine synthase-like glycosyltransferase
VSLTLYFFYGVLIIAVFRLTAQLILAASYNLKGKAKAIDSFPSISIIVPAFNEGITLRSCLKSLIELDYPDYEIIVIDDGSTDKTLEEAKRFEASGVKVIHQKKQGKPSALNNGIKLSKGEIVLTVDADTTLEKRSLQKIASRFVADSRIGAVAGNVKVVPEPSLLNAIQGTEYTVGINLVRKAQSMLGCVMIVPGPIAALKREAVERVGFFSDDTFAEDFDITMKVLKAGYRVEYEDDAISYTDAPKNLEDFMKQRRRWYRGMIQVLDKHRDMYLSRKHGVSGMFGVPNLWFDTISPIFNAALILLALLSGFLIGEPFISLIGIITFFAVEFAIGIFAVSLDPAPKLRDFLAIPFILFYNIFLDGVRLMSLAEEMVNIFMKWEKPRR